MRKVERWVISLGTFSAFTTFINCIFYSPAAVECKQILIMYEEGRGRGGGRDETEGAGEQGDYRPCICEFSIRVGRGVSQIPYPRIRESENGETANGRGRLYGFRKGCSIGDLLAFLNDSWLSSLSRFGETFAVALHISKAFDRVWHKALLSKLPSCGFYPALCSFLSSFLSGHSIAAVVDGHCSTPKPINSGVPQGSVLSPTLPTIHQ